MRLALEAGRRRSFEDTDRVVQRARLTESDKTRITFLLSAGYTVTDIALALRRKGESVFREPTYMLEGVACSAHGQVSLLHLTRRARGGTLDNIDRMLTAHDLDAPRKPEERSGRRYFDPRAQEPERAPTSQEREVASAALDAFSSTLRNRMIEAPLCAPPDPDSRHGGES